MEQRTDPHYVQLMNAIIEYSSSCIINVAITEWYIISHYEERPTVTCLCGKKDCVYVYVIKNLYNNNILAPIGSSCMHYFEWDRKESEILKAYEKWHSKIYTDKKSIYYQKKFHEIIKDVEYVCMIEANQMTSERCRLVEYAKAVWFHNPPPPIKKDKPPPSQIILHKCQKCIYQRSKGYKKCFECFTNQSPKPICQKCEEQKKKGYLLCYTCYNERV
jgi:hypothetical protein